MFCPLFLHMQHREKTGNDPETVGPFWLVLWVQKPWFDLSGMIAKMTKRALDDIRGLVS